MGALVLLVAVVFMSVAYEVADIKGAAAWGTAAFHLLEGFAFAAYHAWGQTLP